jgi:hypothetical protein
VVQASGEVDPRVANSVGYLGGRLMKALHASEIEKRLAALETAVKRTPGAPEFMRTETVERKEGQMATSKSRLDKIAESFTPKAPLALRPL